MGELWDHESSCGKANSIWQDITRDRIRDRKKSKRILQDFLIRVSVIAQYDRRCSFAEILYHSGSPSTQSLSISISLWRTYTWFIRKLRFCMIVDTEVWTTARIDDTKKPQNSKNSSIKFQIPISIPNLNFHLFIYIISMYLQYLCAFGASAQALSWHLYFGIAWSGYIYWG